jgi:uncharacterized integral membrane protein (TIGR00698 family)
MPHSTEAQKPKATPGPLLRTRITRAQELAPGIALAGVIAIAAKYMSEHYGAPSMLMALLFGMAFNYLAGSEKAGAGIKFSSKFVLRVGVALLGVRITWGEIGDLGVGTVALVISGVALTIIGGALIGRAFGLSRDHSVLSAGAVAICGASAALAISSVLPKHQHSERNTILTVIGVTTLSTVAMMIYPLIASLMAFDDTTAGIFIGATIHDVAQVVGAGYMISDEAGETSAIVKLLRVACLTPAVILIGLSFRAQAVQGERAGPIVPIFLMVFLALVALNSFGVIPDSVKPWLNSASHWSLLTAVGALGVRTNLKELTSVGPKPLLALGAQTLLLGLFVLIVLKFGGI